MEESASTQVAKTDSTQPEQSPIFGKKVIFRDVIFAFSVMEAAFSKFKEKIVNNGSSLRRTLSDFWDGKGTSSIENGDLIHRRDCFRSDSFGFFAYARSGARLVITYNGDNITVEALEWANASDADGIIEVFESAYPISKRSVDDKLKRVHVFVGHGRSPLWRDLKDHLSDKHGVKVTAYETGARAGYSIQEVLQEMSDNASLALLVLTGEDTALDGQTHARENVVHETGLFQGRLGFKRAIVLLDEGTTEFSNIAGMQQIRFQQGNIKETFGEVLAILRREFNPHDT